MRPLYREKWISLSLVMRLSLSRLGLLTSGTSTGSRHPWVSTTPAYGLFYSVSTSGCNTGKLRVSELISDP